MIDEYYTWIIFGYHSDDLTKQSKKNVVVVCDNCYEYRVVRYDSVRNLCRKCTQIGKVHTAERIRKAADAKRGQKRTNEQRLTMSIAQRKRPPPPPITDETRHKMSETRKGKSLPLHTEEAKRKMSATRQGIPYEEWTGYSIRGEYCEKFDEACRERIREKYFRRCFMCDKPEDENVDKNDKCSKLCVHHVDQNRGQGCSGVKWKLVPLCKSCHGSAHTEPLKSRIEYLRADEECAHI